MSIRINLAQLVPFYIEGPNPRGIYTKQWAVQTIVRGRLDARNATGHGNRAKRRIEALRAKFEREADAATAEWFEGNLLTAADVDRLADEYEAGSSTRRINFHD